MKSSILIINRNIRSYSQSSITVVMLVLHLFISHLKLQWDEIDFKGAGACWVIDEGSRTEGVKWDSGASPNDRVEPKSETDEIWEGEMNQPSDLKIPSSRAILIKTHSD